MTALRVDVNRVGRAGVWLVAAAPLVVVLLSVVRSPGTTWGVWAALGAFVVLATARPDAALLVATALVGFGVILSHLAGVPELRVTEVLIVATLAGCGLRAAWSRPLHAALCRSLSAPVALLALATVASTVVWQRVYQFETGYATAYVQALLEFAGRSYFVQSGAFRELRSAAVILEGLALFVVAGAWCRIDATFFDRAVRMLAVGGAGLALTSVLRLAEILLRNPDAIAAMRATSDGLRISPQIPDYIAAGSYFTLCWLATLGLALASRQARVVWLAIGLPLVAALYLTGSRSVIAAALAGVLLLGFAAVRQRGRAFRGVLWFAAAAVAAMIVTYPMMTGRDVAGALARQSLTVRGELVRTGLQIIATRPLFGVGVDRFYLLAGGLASPELRALWTGRMNPHNDFLRFGAELGLIGLGLFLAILAAAAWRTLAAVRQTRDIGLAALAAGLAGFLVTSLISNPLMVPEVSYAFWIALGLAAGRAATVPAGAAAAAIDTSGVSNAPRRRSRGQAVAAALLGGLLVLSIPFRARQEIAAIDPRGVSYGLSDWTLEGDGTPGRWTGPRATLFVPPEARLIEIPLAGTALQPQLQQVEVRVDGRLANRVTVGPEWQRLRVLLAAPAAHGVRRIDLRVSPTWVPADVLPGNHDRRELGVKVGTLEVTGPAAGDPLRPLRTIEPH